jgi:uncharacterized protein YozE (UPF0346 family)
MNKEGIKVKVKELILHYGTLGYPTHNAHEEIVSSGMDQEEQDYAHSIFDELHSEYSKELKTGSREMNRTEKINHIESLYDKLDDDFLKKYSTYDELYDVLLPQWKLDVKEWDDKLLDDMDDLFSQVYTPNE